MRKILTTLLLSIASFCSFGQTKINTASSNSVANINNAITGSITASGTDTYTATVTNLTWNSGESMGITFTNGNTGSATFQLNGGTTYTLKKFSSGSLANLSSGDISNGDPKIFYNNGTYLIMKGGSGSGGTSGLVIGTTTVTSGTNTMIPYNNADVLGEYNISGSGSVAMTTNPVFTTPNLGVPSAADFSSGSFTWPTFNQNTSGSAATLTTSRTIGTVTGDATSAGSSFNGSANNTNALTLATVNSNVGTFGSSTSIPTITVNAKGLVTAASGNAVIAPAGTLSGTTLNSPIVTSSLTTVGTIGTGTWQGTAIIDAYIASATTWNAKVSSQWVTTGSDIYYNVGNVMIGSTSAPSSKLHIVETSTATPRAVLVDQYNTGTNGARVTMRKARGTFASPTTIVTGDALASWTASAHDGTAFLESAKILVTSAGTIATNRTPSKIELQTMTDATTGVLTTGLTLDQAQNVTIAGTVGASNLSGTNTGNVTLAGENYLSIASQVITANPVNLSGTNVTSQLPLANGGTNANLTASNGGIFYSTGSAGAILAGTATANKILVSGASGAPSWSTPTFPNASATSGKTIRSDGTNWIASTSTLSDAPSTALKWLRSDGTNWITSTSTLAEGGVTSGKILKSDGTNWTASTETYATPGTSGNILTSDGTNWTSAAPAAPVGTWLLASGGTLTGSNTITSNTANQLNFGGTWTATANSQFHHQFNPSLTARATSSDVLTTTLINPTLIATANSQSLIGTDININYTNGAFSAMKNLGLRMVNGSMLLGGTLSNVSRDTYRLEIIGFGTTSGTGALAVYNSGNNRIIGTADDGELIIGSSSGSAAPRIAAQNNGTQIISGRGLEYTTTFPNSSTNRTGHHFSSVASVSENATTTSYFASSDLTFAPIAGANNLQMWRLQPAINQTGSASGYFAGFVYDPTLTAVLGTNYAFISSSGLSGFGTLTPTYQAQVKGTSANQSLFVVQEDGGTNAIDIKEAAGVKQIGFFAATPVAQQTGDVVTALSNLGLVTSGTLGAVKGTTTNDNATAGNVGESGSSYIATGSAVSLTTATSANVTSVSLTAGDYMVSGIINYKETTSTVTARTGGLTSTSATVPTDGTEGNNGVQSTLTSEVNTITLNGKRFSLSGTTTVYLVAQATFSAGTCAAYGGLTWYRIR